MATFSLASSFMISHNSSAAVDVSLREALSGIAGSISLVSWIVLLLPQLIENHKNGRADALSMVFLSAWFAGDLTNLVGALWGGLLPTVIAVAVYFCFADATLMGQTIYYNRIAAEEKSGARRRSSVFSNDPSQPLIAARGRRRSSAASRRSSRRASLSAAILDEDENPYSPIVRNALSLLGVVAAGALGWVFAWWTGAWKAQQDGNSSEMPLGAEVLGYISAMLYLTARIPQIIRNHQKKSCEGLSLLFFLLSLLGNLTYGAGILLHSSERTYVMDNLPWLIGSLGTMAEDVIIFVQFHMYANSSSIAVFEDEEDRIVGRAG